jgi:hypothetical protein
MKPGSIAMGGYTKDWLPIARRFDRPANFGSIPRPGRATEQR